MPLKVAIPKETAANEKRVAIVPAVAQKLAGMGLNLVVEKGAGGGAQMPDSAYGDSVSIENDAAKLIGSSDVVIKVQPPTVEEAGQLKEGSILISHLYGHNNTDVIKVLRDRKITAFGLELIPRISRAQSMDVLSSQANVSGYKSVLFAADLLPRYLPMLTTAAGTIRPATILVLGVGVAGLQAIATAKRLGAIVEAYDVRPETAEQVRSLGAKFIDTGVSAAGDGGYARELTDEEKAKQQAVLDKHIQKADAVITTAAIPGRPSPKLVSAKAVEGMKDGAVIIDLAAEGGGNCELTKPGEKISKGTVTIYGPLNVPSMMAEHSSELFSKNILNFLSPFVKDGEIELDWEDEILAGAVSTHDGEIRHELTKKAVG